MARFKFEYTAPRWTKMSGFIKRKALYHDLECETEVTKGVLTEKGVVVCRGSDENIIKFKDEYESAIKEYNLD